MKLALPFAVTLFLLTATTLAFSQPVPGNEGPPSIEQPLVREGSFAMELDRAMGLGGANNETEAESNLGALGIAPRNGWIADYPVTPDIIGEIRQAVSDAVDSGRLTLGKDDALTRFDDVASDFGLSVIPSTVAGSGAALPENAPAYPDPAVINNYYDDEGPPIVTYFTPPPVYYYLYAWVPFPFWCSGFWFPGYYILNDFHRPFFFGDHAAFVSNHFNDVRAHRVFRIDPVARFSGRTFAGIGAPRGHFLSTGVRGSAGSVFNAARSGASTGGVHNRPALTGDRSLRTGVNRPSATGRVRSFGVPSGGGHRSFTPSTGGRSFTGPFGRGVSTFAHPSGVRSSFSSPTGAGAVHGIQSGGNRSFAAPSGIGSYGYHSGGGAVQHVPSYGTRSFTPSVGGGRSFSMPSGGSSGRGARR